MRIEYQGHVEVRPSYSHVGYISAMPMPGVFKANSAAAGVFIGLALLFVVAARRIAGRGKDALHLLGFLACVAVAGAAAIACVLALTHYDLTPPFTLTMQRMEHLSEATETFAKQHKRLPTQTEWSQLASPTDQIDGWGHRLVYETVNPFADRDGQSYQVKVGEQTQHICGPVSSVSFGADGLFGTRDDLERADVALGPLRYRNVNLTTFVHARTPRPRVTANAY